MSEESSYEEWPEVETADEALEIFYSTLFDFAGIIVTLCQEEERTHPRKYKDKLKPSSKIILIRGLLQLFSKQDLIKHYINHVMVFRDKLDARDDLFFLESNGIFASAPEEDVEFFRDMWRPDSSFHLSAVEKETVFEYFDTMLEYCAQWKRLSGYTSIADLVAIIKEKGEDEAYKYIMSQYNVEDFSDFDFEPTYDEFVAKHVDQ